MSSVLSDALSIRFSGRVPRRTFWVSVLLNSVFLTLLESMYSQLWMTPMTEKAWMMVRFILYGVYLLQLLLIFSVSVRRLHDIGRSGLWAVVFLLPLVGTFCWLIMGCLAGRESDNRYGPDPCASERSRSDAVAVVSALSELEKLRREGAVTEEEYALQKKKLLSQND